MTCWLCEFETKSPSRTCKNGACQICAQVAKIDEEINQAAAALRRLLTKRYDLLSEQNRIHDPIHRLPLELRNYTFGLVLPPRDEWGQIVQDGSGKAVIPPYLTSICRSWRDIALSNPLFWSTIPIVLGTLSPSDPPSWMKFVHDWISRSRTLPLTLHIVVHKSDQDSKDDLESNLKFVLDVIGQCSNEWKSLSLEIPFSLSRVLHYDNTNFQSHLLSVRRLRVISTNEFDEFDEPMTPLHSKMSPEKIELYGLPFRSLEIEWNHLTSATFESFDLEDVTELFQHASEMTYCAILDPQPGSPNFVVPSIIHRKLKTLSLSRQYEEEEAIRRLLDSLTLPCLRDFRTTDTDLLAAGRLPALVHRSSCPLTHITFLRGENSLLPLQDLRPLPGVTDLVLEMVCDGVVMAKPLLEGYFPDLRHLTLGVHAFIDLCEAVIFPLFPDPQLPPPAASSNERTLRKVFVLDLHGDVLIRIWDSEIGKRLKSFRSNVNCWEDGFEILVPKVVTTAGR